jgi:hypothetical protein
MTDTPPPRDFDCCTPHATLAELEAILAADTPVVLTPQDDLLTALDELLDNALHSDRCYIGPNDTTCVCVIGKVRAALPLCEAVQDRPMLGEPRDTSYWRCQRTAHPSQPAQHYFSEA